MAMSSVHSRLLTTLTNRNRPCCDIPDFKDLGADGSAVWLYDSISAKVEGFDVLCQIFSYTVWSTFCKSLEIMQSSRRRSRQQFLTRRTWLQRCYSSLARQSGDVIVHEAGCSCTRISYPGR